MSLSDRLRDCEAAPWVIGEIKKLEAENLKLRDDVERMKIALHRIEELLPLNELERRKIAREALEGK